MNFDRLTGSATEALENAEIVARIKGAKSVSIEHLFVALDSHEMSPAGWVFERFPVFSHEDRAGNWRMSHPEAPLVNTKSLPREPEVGRVLELAFQEADKVGSELVDDAHLLLGLVLLGEGEPYKVLVKAVGEEMAMVKETLEQPVFSPPPPGPNDLVKLTFQTTRSRADAALTVLQTAAVNLPEGNDLAAFLEDVKFDPWGECRMGEREATVG